ncbi:MAG: guanylate kinase, partial [Nisaea sp.]
MSEGFHPDMQRRGLMLVLSSPSGAGKTSISRRLLET